MEVREAKFGNDVIDIGGLLNDKCKGKSNIRICRSRADLCVKRSVRSKGFFCKCLVAEREGDIIGFLYAEERQFFDLIPTVRLVEVHFLVGSGGCAVRLLKRLRQMTVQRILILHWGIAGRSPKSFERLIKTLGPQQVAAAYQI